MNNSPRWTRFVIQERVRNHAAIADLSGSETLQTVRLTTWITPDSRIELPRAFFKIAVGDNITDNYNSGATGNLKANLDPTTGKLAKAIQASSDGIGFSELSTHPVAESRFPDFRFRIGPPSWHWPNRPRAYSFRFEQSAGTLQSLQMAPFSSKATRSGTPRTISSSDLNLHGLVWLKLSR